MQKRCFYRPPRRPPRSSRGKTPHGQLLHRPADLRDRSRLAHASGRRHLHLHPADRPVPRDHTPAGAGDHHLHRRRCPDRRRDRHHADRAAGQRRERDDLLQFRQHQQRRLHDRCNLRRRLFPGYRRGRHPEPGADRPGRPPARSQAVRRDDQENLDRYGLRGEPGFTRRPLRFDIPRQLRADLRPRRRSDAFQASAT